MTVVRKLNFSYQDLFRSSSYLFSPWRCIRWCSARLWRLCYAKNEKAFWFFRSAVFWFFRFLDHPVFSLVVKRWAARRSVQTKVCRVTRVQLPIETNFCFLFFFIFFIAVQLDSKAKPHTSTKSVRRGIGCQSGMLFCSFIQCRIQCVDDWLNRSDWPDMRLRMMDNNIDQTSSSVVKALDRKQKSCLVTGVQIRPGTKNFFCFFLFLFLFSSTLRSPHSYSHLYFVSTSFPLLQRQSIFLKFDLRQNNAIQSILSQPSTAKWLVNWNWSSQAIIKFQ